MSEFAAVRVSDSDEGFKCQLKTLSLAELPDSEVLIQVYYSALNYKDALSAAGHKGVTRHFPHTPGIDAAGIVVEDSSGRFQLGDRVIVSGFDFGMNTDGGLAEYCRVPAGWVCPCPGSLSFFAAMALGTAGITAALALEKLHRQLPEVEKRDSFVVSGASGGVGSVAIQLAAAQGYAVTAITAKPEEFERLRKLGASSCVEAEQWQRDTGKALLSPEFSAGLDTLGGSMLANLLKAIKPEGALACCGMALSPELQTTVYPFILRGISLLGVDSAEIGLEHKARLWEALSRMSLDLTDLTTEVTLEQVPGLLEQMLQAKTRGRYTVKIAAEA